MKKYLMARIQTVVAWTLFVAIAAILIEAAYPGPGTARLFMGFSFAALFFPISFIKPNWFIMLPYSRRKLLVYHFAETCGVYIVVFSALALLNIYFGQVRGYGPPEYSLGFLFFGSIAIGLIRCAMPVSQASQRSFQSVDLFLRRKSAFLLVCYGLIVFACILLREEPWAYFAGPFFVVTLVPWGTMRSLATPQRTLKKLRTTSFIFYAVFVAVVASAGIFVVEKMAPSSETTNFAIIALGHIPLPLSDDRTRDLFASEKIFFSPMMERKANQNPNRIPYAQWMHRTEKCLRSECLDLSDSFLRADITENEKFAAFAAMMKICMPNLKSEGSIRCLGPKLSPVRLDRWLTKLSTSSQVDAWLMGDDDKRQLIAIRALAKNRLSETQLARIKMLAKGGTRLVARAADIELNDYMPNGKADLKAFQSCDWRVVSACPPPRLSVLF